MSAARRSMRRGIVGAAVLALLATIHACATPTQVTVVITTSFPCKQLAGVTITVGPGSREVEDKLKTKFVTTKRQTCDGERVLGSLVVVPGQASAAIVVVGALTGDPTACAPPDYKGCLVARRSFSFVEHAALTIPIELEEACKDVPCNAVTTCAKGTCIPSQVTCADDGCSGIGGTSDAGIDASFADAASDAASEDAPVGMATDGGAADSSAPQLEGGVVGVGMCPVTPDNAAAYKTEWYDAVADGDAVSCDANPAMDCMGPSSPNTCCYKGPNGAESLCIPRI